MGNQPAVEEFDADFDTFFTAYLECAVWSSTSIHPEDWEAAEPEFAVMPLEEMGLSVDDLSPECIAKLKEDCLAFWDNEPDCHSDPGEAGHCFWLSRNGHGAGFFDSDWDGHSDELQKAARVYGSVDLYVDKDCKIQAQ